MKIKLTSLAGAAFASFWISLLVSCGASKTTQPLVIAESTTAASILSGHQPTTESRVISQPEALMLGQTKLKTPIKAVKFGSGERVVVVLAGIHGDERSSTDVAEAFVASLQKAGNPANTTIVVIPMMNPDGIALGKRTNSNGVDINRNFPASSWRAEFDNERYAPGRHPGSEFETRALVKLLNKHSIALVVSIHAPLNCINWDGPGGDIAQVMSEVSGFPLKEEIGYETPGSLGSYLGKDKGIPTITLELQSAAKSERVLQYGLMALQAAIAHIGRMSAEEHRRILKSAD